MPDALTLPEPPYLAKTVREALEDKAALNNASRIILGLVAGLCCTNRVMAEVPPSPDGLIPQLP